MKWKLDDKNEKAEIVNQEYIDKAYFGEGITILDESMYLMLTW